MARISAQQLLLLAASDTAHDAVGMLHGAFYLHVQSAAHPPHSYAVNSSQPLL